MFEGTRRAAAVLYNEKVTCELGRGLHNDGRLNPQNVARALMAVERFAAIARSVGADLNLLGTAAVRDAVNGAEFALAVRDRVGVTVDVLSGAEEARLAALGVASGIPGATGIVGDLGGGSLELVAVGAGRAGRHGTLPIGPLRLMDLGESATSAPVRDAVDRHLSSVPWLPEASGAMFYAVGGAWRALARLHMAQVKYPLHVLHHYRMTPRDADELCGLVARMGRQSLRGVVAVSRNRLAALPWAGLVLQRLIRTARPGAIVFSANGLREGVLFDRLTAAERRRDPLIAACMEAARGRERYAPHGEALRRFTAPVFPSEDARIARLRHAASTLSDIGWREHPEHRAESALEAALYLPDGCLTHDERAWLALALHGRYGGDANAPITAMPRGLLASEDAALAHAVGLSLRLGYALSGGVPGLLRHVAIVRAADRLDLRVGPRLAPLMGELVERRLRILADAIGVKSTTITPDTTPRRLAAVGGGR